jgi:hypothetical protein
VHDLLPAVYGHCDAAADESTDRCVKRLQTRCFLFDIRWISVELCAVHFLLLALLHTTTVEVLLLSLLIVGSGSAEMAVHDSSWRCCSQPIEHMAIVAL